MPFLWLRPLAMFLLACVAALAAGPAAGHSILIEAVPAQGAKLTVAPQTILLRFNAKIEPALTKVSLVDGQNRRTPLALSPASKVDRILAELPTLAPGVYTVVYKVLATDGHVTQGSVRFTLLAE